jgi:hypothetical protein
VSLGLSFVFASPQPADLRHHLRTPTKNPFLCGTQGTVQKVPLDSHDVVAAYQPYAEIIVDGRHVATVHFELRLVLTVDGLTIQIISGRIVAVELARCRYSATLACENVEFPVREGVLDLEFTQRLRNGVQLAAAT